MHHYRRVIRIRGQDSPNVRLAEMERRLGREPSHRMLVPGVLPYSEYLKRRETWDVVRQTIGLDAEFYEGVENLLFPPEWLNLAEAFALQHGTSKRGKTLGVDSAAGGDNTAFAVCDDSGLQHLASLKTPDTTKIVDKTLALAREFLIADEMIFFDAGGGGKQHADRLRRLGHNVRLVAFGESVTPEKRRGLTTVEQRVKQDEQRYVYRNRRAQMYHLIRLAIEPQNGACKFALPSEIINRRDGSRSTLREQLAPIPLLYDAEGRIYLLSKNKRDASDTRQTLTDLVGHSPDEADALALAVYGLRQRVRPTAGVAF